MESRTSVEYERLERRLYYDCISGDDEYPIRLQVMAVANEESGMSNNRKRRPFVGGDLEFRDE